MKTISWNRTLIVFTFLLFTVSVFAKSSGNERISRTQYIDTWKDVAIENMLEFKIPASITLAQGILESGDGNSELAKMSNNHFGIKCHGWEGDKVYYDDDAKGECFRKYDDAGASFADHSQFLLRKRYASLFELKLTDYKGWAKGLKKCGYATDPAYAKLLIGIIEKYDLAKFDKVKQLPKKEEVAQVEETESVKEETPKVELEGGKEIPAKIEISTSHQVKISSNNIKFVIAKVNDDLESLAKEVELPVFLLKKYNNFSEDKKLEEGDVVYIQPKRNKAKKEWHIVENGQSMKEISQMHGIKLRVLYKKNNLKFGTEPKAGTKLSLKAKIRT